ncbi:MAG: malto-oligosyltrehalose synthase [Actinomycetota bacterium]|nr:malto-oligosyltrehalose synthase [Actinomycetota bacterium]
MKAGAGAGAGASADRLLRATYRLQLTPDFGFADARALIPYLRDLGISHLYLSPSLQARPGSTHGYDVIDPTRISSELGGEDELRALAQAAHDARLGLVLDIVPNHMATDEGNRFWADPRLREQFFDLDPISGRHRRFFDVDDLAGVRQEDPVVFAATHRLVLELVSEGVIDALRIDHPDGMADPAGYLTRLHDAGVATVWIEKILDAGERLRDWPVTGTVGYEFLNAAIGLFVDPAAQPAFTALWEHVSGDPRRFSEIALQAKFEQAATTFTPELERLARAYGEPVEPAELVRAVAHFPIYRTYVIAAGREGGPAVDDADRRAIDETGMAGELASALLLQRPASAEFVTRFQQTTGPVVAKGVEDTAFYRYGRLAALCEVGGDPGRFGVSIEGFHRVNRERAQRFPAGMLTSNTHDTKRSADVRARITALTWIPAEWTVAVRRWLELTDELVAGGAPDDVERYFIFQTLLGAWPIEAERMTAYMEKALREAKRNSNWITPDEAWERRVMAFVTGLYTHTGFLSVFAPFVERAAEIGDRIALGQVALKLTAPGVPDIYQGDELAFHALVDPDNRRPVDWEWRQALLARLSGGAEPDRETIKLALTRRLLQLRIRRPQAFGPEGGYAALQAGDGAVAYRRGEDVVIAVGVGPHGIDAELHGAEGRWRDLMSDGELTLDDHVPLGELIAEHGLIVLERV